MFLTSQRWPLSFHDRYVEIGDQIALQYGGSEAHKKVASAGANSNIPGPMGKVRSITSSSSYFMNTYLSQPTWMLWLSRISTKSC